MGQYICSNCRMGVERKGDCLQYRGVIRKVIKEIKYRGSYAMVNELVDLWDPHYKDQYTDAVVTAVPMWKPKERVRGFNQAELIAKELAWRWHLQYRRLLIRTRETRPMYGLSKTERIDNVRGAFRASDVTQPTKIVLVDDVWTTGATMRECELILTRFGTDRVFLLTLAG